MPLALGVEALEHLALERPRLQVEMEDRGGLSHRRRANGAVEAVGIPSGIVRLVAGIGPVALERGLELLDQVRRRRLRQTNVPLNAVQHGAVRQVGRSDIRRRVPGQSFEQPRLRVQPRRPRVVRDFDLGADRREPVERAALRGPGVHGGDDAERPARVAVCLERGTNDAETVPANEGAQQVDAVGRMNLPLDRHADRRLTAGVDEQVCRRQRNQGIRCRLGERCATAKGPNLAQDLQRDDEVLSSGADSAACPCSRSHTSNALQSSA